MLLEIKVSKVLLALQIKVIKLWDDIFVNVIKLYSDIFVKTAKLYSDIFVKTAKLYGGLFIKSSQAVLQHKQGAMRNHHLLKQVPEVLQNIICHDALAETAIIRHSLFCRKQRE